MINRINLLTGIIDENPGIHFNELVRKSGIKNGTLTHYMNKLELDGSIKIHREIGKTRYFSPLINDDEVKIIQFLRKETSKDIILALVEKNGLEFQEIKKIIHKSSPSTSQNLSKLLISNLIIAKIIETKKKFYIKNDLLIGNLIKKYNFN
jgi:predicted transcriptional regulator